MRYQGRNQGWTAVKARRTAAPPATARASSLAIERAPQPSQPSRRLRVLGRHPRRRPRGRPRPHRLERRWSSARAALRARTALLACGEEPRATSKARASTWHRPPSPGLSQPPASFSAWAAGLKGSSPSHEEVERAEGAPHRPNHEGACGRGERRADGRPRRSEHDGPDQRQRPAAASAWPPKGDAVRHDQGVEGEERYGTRRLRSHTPSLAGPLRRERRRPPSPRGPPRAL